MNFELLDPVLNLEKGFLIGDVKDEKETHGITEKGCCEATEALLSCNRRNVTVKLNFFIILQTCCIPKLQMNSMVDAFRVVKLRVRTGKEALK